MCMCVSNIMAFDKGNKRGRGNKCHVDVFTALKYSNMIRGINVQNITSYYTEYFNTVLASVSATYTLPLLGSSITA